MRSKMHPGVMSRCAEPGSDHGGLQEPPNSPFLFKPLEFNAQGAAARLPAKFAQPVPDAPVGTDAALHHFAAPHKKLVDFAFAELYFAMQQMKVLESRMANRVEVLA